MLIRKYTSEPPVRSWPAPGADGRSATPQREIRFGIDEALALMDEAGINRAVIVPPSWEGDYSDLALAAAHRHPERFVVMGRIAPERPEAPAQIAGWRKQPGMLGLRFMFNAHDDAFGPQRMFRGTDISRSSCGYRETVELLTRELSWLSATDLEWIMGRGVCEGYGWAIPR